MEQEQVSTGRSSYVKIVLLALIFSLAANIWLGYKHSALNQELGVQKQKVVSRSQSVKILNFASLFVDKVLQTGTEVGFETRYELESAVRSINDEEISAQWKKVTDSTITKEQAQLEVKKLLELLIEKAKVE